MKTMFGRYVRSMKNSGKIIKYSSAPLLFSKSNLNILTEANSPPEKDIPAFYFDFLLKIPTIALEMGAKIK